MYGEFNLYVSGCERGGENRKKENTTYTDKRDNFALIEKYERNKLLIGAETNCITSVNIANKW